MTERQHRVFENYLKAQIHYFENEKWYEGERRHKDPGMTYVLELIEKRAKEFRAQWDVSRCCKCAKGGICGDKLKEECEEFKSI